MAKEYIGNLKDLIEINYEEYDMSMLDPEMYLLEKEKLVENTGQKSFPYVYVDNQFIGGFSEMRDFFFKIINVEILAEF